jgi:hypothetical protein
MNPNDLPAAATHLEPEEDLLAPLLQATNASFGRIDGVVIGELLAIADDGATPIVRCPAQADEATLRARSAVDLHGQHIGAQVVLMFEQGDPARPIVMGVLRNPAGWPVQDMPAQVQVDADGQRLIVNAREQLVLRCGKASITLTRSGKVLIEGSYLLSRSSGVNRIKGGSVQLN